MQNLLFDTCIYSQILKSGENKINNKIKQIKYCGGKVEGKKKKSNAERVNFKEKKTNAKIKKKKFQPNDEFFFKLNLQISLDIMKILK